jgi:hypothetical protein
VDALAERLAHAADEPEADGDLGGTVALGFLACVKALRESGLMLEVAIREEIQEIHALAAEVRGALERTEETVELNQRLLHEARAARPAPEG